MLLRELVAASAGIGLQVVAADAGSGDAEITAVVHDTADVVPGALFCCVRGSRVDGHDLAGKAVAAGAAALVVDHVVTAGDHQVPQVLVDDVRAAMGPLAAAFWGQPSQQLTMVGVTGTAGKTTVTHLLQSVLNRAGMPCGIIGTLSGARTTPEATELQAALFRATHDGLVAMTMEVSSHGLDLHRVDGTRFAVAVFTNLSRDHLDFHHSMDDYFAAKSRLFTPEFTDRAVICTDDPWGRRLLETVGAGSGIDAVGFGAEDASDVELGPEGVRFVWRGQPMSLPMPGRFNVLNALAAATAADLVGVDRAAIAAGLAEAPPVPGRFEPVAAGQPFAVLVDYSHKPDALEHALQSARELTPRGRVLVVFGCGGDRDTTKRPLMGEVAARLADRVMVTSDNPRSEDPLDIIDQVVAGIPADRLDQVVVEADRARAIELAIGEARSGDVVLIAGKGHESTQTIGDQVLPFDDRVVAREALVTTTTWKEDPA
ncbi:MAG TPA: UDP-N-acetylmuramoyl-L-alanyl-D-glutamate--2,6-diaminopimelate ligase [Acidimicrobiales bacterium]